MNGVGLLSAIVIGILAGWIAEKVLKRNHGLITNLAVGVVGALLGSFGAGLLGVSYGGFVGTLVVATLGAIVLLLLLGLVRRR
jgi:uncharacterized membrane protein YeaQ/YmgE (transglycosylase-associated protein family)